ncbi:MAG: DUF4869 domain-containing protein [Eubacteriales bacterium]|nr:DUF4869 domain-containing protein [Eubacteriales bacterium]
MLSIYYGETEKPVYYGPAWFKYNYEPSWLEDSFVQEMMKDIDDSVYTGGHVIESPVLGQIPPEKLSGGLQTLIMIYENPDKIFDATSCGPNCSKWLLEIGRKKDITVNLHYFMPFDEIGNNGIMILNENRIVKTQKELTAIALDYL